MCAATSITGVTGERSAAQRSAAPTCNEATIHTPIETPEPALTPALVSTSVSASASVSAPVMRGTLYIIAAASGTGKTSLANALAASMPNMKISISHTTRPLRNGEQRDVNYFYVSERDFFSMVQQDAFLEYAKVFDHYYGTSRFFVENELRCGHDVILDIDWQGARAVRQKMPQCVSVFLLPPSKDELRERLEKRKRDAQNVIEQRLALVSSEVAHYNEFDYVVVNDGFTAALQDLQAIVRARRLREEVQALQHRALLEELLM